ncbi:MAG TPA: VOC family protein [Vicinamibacteria bacterium]|nr:VOC family protein [Vicinamibacteria bacterium]
MAHVDKHEPGSFSWAELATTDAGAAKSFYGGLFGWTHVDNQAGPDMVYTRFQLGGRDVAAAYPQDKGQREQGIPPNWMSYVTVASADASAAQARKLGGTVMMEPFDVMEHGRMAVLQDPTGAVLSVWQPRQHIGVQVRDEDNSLCWNELYTRDTTRAEAFFVGLFGWRAKRDPGGYTEWLRGETAVGGMIAIEPEWGPMPAHWLPYFQVRDCDATAARASELGGGVMMPARDIANVGRFAILRDPQGAAFAVIKLTR